MRTELRPKPWMPIVIVLSGLLLLVILSTAYYYFALPQSVKAVSTDSESLIPFDSAIRVDFNRPLNRKEFSPTITPAVAGSWRFTNMLIGKHFARSAYFVPETILQPDTTYTISLDGINNVLKIGSNKTHNFTLTTESLPEVVSTQPANGADSITTISQITFQLDKRITPATEWRLLAEPAIEHQLITAGSTINIIPKKQLRQGTEYKWQLERSLVGHSRTTGEIVERHTGEIINRGDFKVLPPPNIADISPSGDKVLTSKQIVITFDRQMDTASVETGLTIEPETAGVIEWDDTQTEMSFKPTNGLAFDTNYNVKVAAGTKDLRAGFLDEEVSYDFKTIGPVKVLAFSPADGVGGVTIGSTIRAGFDQDIDKNSAETKFIISPNVSGTFSWDGRTIVFDPSQALAFDTTYTVSLASGIASINGQPSKEDFSAHFTTQPETTMLNIALDYQDKPLSCEAAALKMALSYKGVAVSETDIMNIIGIDMSPRQGDTWNDPNEIFVGDINGRQNSTGYGVHWAPIGKAANNWRPSEVFTNWSTEQILLEVAAGHPVIIWGIYPGGYYDPWSTAEGKQINAWKGEHTRTIIGFVGSPSNPGQIILNDPISGREYWSRQTFENNISTFNNSGVVIR
ncbi:Ig-like domain-containing protein [Patescibacteria group bacterium]